MITIKKNQPAVILAPMEGVTDYPMRVLLTELGGLNFCVSEFLRISQMIPNEKVFFKHVPELAHNCQTPSGTPVQIQLLGGDAEKLAAAALEAVKFGAKSIDLNFGCPAATVNRHDGGATLLKYPDRIEHIVKTVRSSLPASIPLSAKMRLGWDNIDDVITNAQKAALGGASWITIHARTKVQGYAPPVYWGQIGVVRKELDIPVVANGDINTLEDFFRCQEETQCEHFMIGRGAVANPYLAREISQQLGINSSLSLRQNKNSWKEHMQRFIEIAHQNEYADQLKIPQKLVGRIKQWGNMIHQRTPIAWFEQIKTLKELNEMLQFIP